MQCNYEIMLPIIASCLLQRVVGLTAPPLSAVLLDKLLAGSAEWLCTQFILACSVPVLTCVFMSLCASLLQCRPLKVIMQTLN